MNEFIKKMIEEKRALYEELEAKANASDSVEEVREIGEALKTLRDEITEAEEALEAAEDDGNDDGNDDGAGEEGRGFNPIAAYNMRTGSADRAAEKRANAFVTSGRMSIDTSEARATLVSTGHIATPTGVGGVNDQFNIVSSIVDQVKVDDCAGMGTYEVAYEKSVGDATLTTEGDAVTEGDVVFRYATIQPFSVDIITYVSKKIRKLTPLQYEEKIKEAALNALKKKVGALIVGGTGSSQPYGIINAKNDANESICETLEIATGGIDETTLRKIVFAYGGNENVGGNATLYLNKTDLIAFGDVRGTNEKAAVYEIMQNGDNPNTGTIKDGGLIVPYCINSNINDLAAASVNDLTMIYGDPMNYTLGLFSNYEVNVSEDFKFSTKQLSILGEVEVGGNVCVEKGFVVVKAVAAQG